MGKLSEGCFAVISVLIAFLPHTKTPLKQVHYSKNHLYRHQCLLYQPIMVLIFIS